ncbi:type II toxin-antitoxin system VapC family toxin [Chakrabartia godavariana]|nr:type II toxin-antitoxin system VapC family toxin [Chakrabartia godavariana]
MIVLDSSAVVAILKREPDAETFQIKLSEAAEVMIGAPTKFELLMVMARWRQKPAVDLAVSLLGTIGAKVVPWDDALTMLAVKAEFDFGKGRHPANLNFGDCMAYALAKSLDSPLLFKGDDFSKTDVKSAL